ncbi:MAG TPA: His/Gly/Thr/Pro-type tRNA ligase C-terminal domain-containing protein [Candidatus Binatia bacterium]|nr:His/Gly/Thr/Pro-type tRNA ligase C-terminal domain-containing protein [Candidatus Binatia bacterium]
MIVSSRATWLTIRRTNGKAALFSVRLSSWNTGVNFKQNTKPNPIKAKIQDAETAKVHTMLVIGPRDMNAGNVSVRLHGKGNVGAKPRGEVIAQILKSIRDRVDLT